MDCCEVLFAIPCSPGEREGRDGRLLSKEKDAATSATGESIIFTSVLRGDLAGGGRLLGDAMLQPPPLARAPLRMKIRGEEDEAENESDGGEGDSDACCCRFASHNFRACAKAAASLRGPIL